MKARTIFPELVLLTLLCAIAVPVRAQTARPEQTLNQYVVELQSSPNDMALRGKIIALVQTMSPQPAIPEEARRHYVVGKTLADGAKKPEEFNDAIAEFKSALLLAPWWPEANRDYALTLEAAERFDEDAYVMTTNPGDVRQRAAQNELDKIDARKRRAEERFDEAAAYVKLYMATNPGDKQLRAAQDELYMIDARKKRAEALAQYEIEQWEKECCREHATTPPQDSFEALLRKIDGRRYTAKIGIVTVFIDVRGRILVYGNLQPKYEEIHRFEIVDRETTVPETEHNPALTAWVDSLTYIISEDGDRVTVRSHMTDGYEQEHIYLWQR